MKILVILLLCAPLIANACNATKHMIDKLVLNGDIAVTFKPNGTASSVTCDVKKYSVKQCEHLTDHIFEYYHKHKKG